MSPARPRLLVDVTQYVSWPATSGVQRVLAHLSKDWVGDNVDARFGFLDDDRYSTGALNALGDVIGSTFQTDDDEPSSAEVRRTLARAVDQSLSTADVEKLFEAYMLPEPTLQADSLAVASRLSAARRTPSFFVYYDPLPLTHPQLYARGADGNGTVTRYHGLLALSDNVAFISRNTREVFERRLARRVLDNAIVARPGADSLSRRDPLPTDQPMYVMLGTVEPRKRHRIVLDAFDRLWATGRNYRLVVLGRSGWEEPDLSERLHRLAATRNLEWIENVSDRQATDLVARSWGVLFTPFSEGYGLPPLEALALGCPVIVSADLPALDGLGRGGQIRLATVTAESIAAAVETLADPVANAAYRSEIAELRLPTWKQFSRDIEEWVASTLGPDEVELPVRPDA